MLYHDLTFIDYYKMFSLLQDVFSRACLFFATHGIRKVPVLGKLHGIGEVPVLGKLP
jgi:hypothetical protein